jgi:hypothetical protein
MLRTISSIKNRFHDEKSSWDVRVEFLCQSAAGRQYRTKIPLPVAPPNFIQAFDLNSFSASEGRFL